VVASSSLWNQSPRYLAILEFVILANRWLDQQVSRLLLYGSGNQLSIQGKSIALFTCFLPPPRISSILRRGTCFCRRNRPAR
jgi:hypothetical protein